MCMRSYSIIWVESCNRYLHQDTKLFHPHKHSFLLLLYTHIHPHHHISVFRHSNFVISRLLYKYDHKITQYIIFWDLFFYHWALVSGSIQVVHASIAKSFLLLSKIPDIRDRSLVNICLRTDTIAVWLSQANNSF